MFLIHFNQWKCACVRINNWVPTSPFHLTSLHFTSFHYWFQVPLGCKKPLWMPLSGCIYNTLTMHCPIFKIQGLSRYKRYRAAGRGRKITAVHVATLSCLAYCHFHSFLYLTLIVLMWRIGWAHNNARKKIVTSSVYDCTVEDVEYICNSNSCAVLVFIPALSL